MVKMFDSFIKNAPKFNKNPLSIIALFISLIYGFACLVLGFTNVGLDKDQKWPLIWFIVVFPIVVLLAFVYLVVNHHKKLYGPGDYKEDESFLRTLDIEQQRKRIEESIDSPDCENKEEVHSTPSNEKAEQDNNVNDKNECKYCNGTKDKYVSVNSKMQLYQSSMLAEELVLRQLENELKTTIKRQIGLHTESSTIGLDGLIFDERQFIGIEIKYARYERVSISMMTKIINIAESIEKIAKTSDAGKEYKFIIAFVLDEQERFIIDNLKARLKEIKINTEVKIYRLSDLKKRFGL